MSAASVSCSQLLEVVDELFCFTAGTTLGALPVGVVRERRHRAGRRGFQHAVVFVPRIIGHAGRRVLLRAVAVGVVCVRGDAREIAGRDKLVRRVVRRSHPGRAVHLHQPIAGGVVSVRRVERIRPVALLARELIRGVVGPGDPIAGGLDNVRAIAETSRTG